MLAFQKHGDMVSEIRRKSERAWEGGQRNVNVNEMIFQAKNTENFQNETAINHCHEMFI